jgi:hypothetical protein
MIDTDKYEGHTPAPWRTAEGQPYDDEGSHLDIVDANGVLVTETSYFTDNDHPNARLIADAPLLLAEVKRLRKLFSIDEGSRDEGYCITMRLEGCEYIGTLRLYKDEEGKVIE